MEIKEAVGGRTIGQQYFFEGVKGLAQQGYTKLYKNQLAKRQAKGLSFNSGAHLAPRKNTQEIFQVLKIF